MCCNFFGAKKTKKKIAHQLAFDKKWKKFRTVFIILGIFQLLLAIIIALTEFGNVLQDFWYTNVFGGFWTCGILFISVITLYVSGKHTQKSFFNLTGNF